MATILMFSPQGAASREAPHAATPAEIIVFPRTDIRALRRLTDGGDLSVERSIDLPGENAPA